MYQDTGPKNTCLLFLGDDDKCNKDVLTGVQTCPNRQVETESTCWLYLGDDDRHDKVVLTVYKHVPTDRLRQKVHAGFTLEVMTGMTKLSSQCTNMSQQTG